MIKWRDNDWGASKRCDGLMPHATLMTFFAMLLHWRKVVDYIRGEGS